MDWSLENVLSILICNYVPCDKIGAAVIDFATLLRSYGVSVDMRRLKSMVRECQRLCRQWEDNI